MNESKEVYPWDQLPDEPITAYRNFLVYRDIGPGRTFEKAYEVKKGVKKRIPGSFQRQANDYRWQERATAWDIEQMSQYGTKAVINWVLSIVELSEQTLIEIQSGRLKPRSFDQLLGALDVLGKFVTPETVEAAREFVRGDFGRSETD